MTIVYLANFIGTMLSNAVRVQAMGESHWKGIRGERHVSRLNGDDVEPFIVNNKVVMLFFYSPSCPHCQELTPEYAEAAEILSNLKPDVKMSALDVIRNKDARKKYKLSGVPTVNLYKDGVFIAEFTRIRKAKNLVDFAKTYAS